VAEVLRKLEAEITMNKFDDVLSKEQAKQQFLSNLTPKDKQFVEEIDQEFYRRVETSDDYYKRKRLILLNLDRLQRKVESTAKNFDDFERLRFIMLEKAKQKRSVLRNFMKNEQSHSYTPEDDNQTSNK
jgi:hypothetical protein